MLPEPDADESLRRLTREDLAEDHPDLHPALRALTRWEDAPTLQVVCLWGQAQEWFWDRGCTEPVPRRTPLTEETAQRLLQREARLSGHALCRDWPGPPAPDCWRRHALLRHLRPAVFDPQGELASPASSFGLRWDEQLGLMVEYLPNAEEDR